MRATAASFSSSDICMRPPAAEPACMARHGIRYSSMKRIHQRIFQRCSGSVGVKRGPSTTSSRYSMAGVDSNMAKPSAKMAGTVPFGLIFTYSGRCCSSAPMLT